MLLQFNKHCWSSAGAGDRVLRVPPVGAVRSDLRNYRAVGGTSTCFGRSFPEQVVRGLPAAQEKIAGAGEICTRDRNFGGGDLLAPHVDAALLDRPAGVALR